MADDGEPKGTSHSTPGEGAREESTGDDDALDAGERRIDLTPFVAQARSGFRSDVAALAAALDEALLVFPMAEAIPGAEAGVEHQLPDDLELVPQLLRDQEGSVHCPVFTSMSLVDVPAERLDWTTSGGDLECCSLPARVALSLLLQVVDDKSVHHAVINPMSDSELVLTRDELSGIVRGQPIPIVRYITSIPDKEGDTLVAEQGDAAATPALLAALDHCVESITSLLSYRVERSFNPERDVVPHLTVRLAVTAEADQRAVADTVFAAIREELPPPGYVDLLFDEAPLRPGANHE